MALNRTQARCRGTTSLVTQLYPCLDIHFPPHRHETHRTGSSARYAPSLGWIDEEGVPLVRT